MKISQAIRTLLACFLLFASVRPVPAYLVGDLIRPAGSHVVMQLGLGPTALDTVLELHDGSGALISTNHNWRSAQQADILATGIPPTDGRESATVATLQPGSYTAIVHGQNNTTGVALVEVYDLDSNASK